MSLSTLKERIYAFHQRSARALRTSARRTTHHLTRVARAGAGAVGVSQITKSVRVEVDPDEVEKRCHTTGSKLIHNA